LEEIANRLVQQGKAPLKSKMARELLKAGDNQEILYHKYLSAIAQKEYQALNKTLERIALISELNLVYLISQAEKNENNKVVSSAAVANKNSSASSPESNTETSPETSSEPTSTNLIESYLRRGKKLIDNKDYSKAVLELREALKLEPKNSNVHTLLGLAYFKQNHLGMAKIHINKALQLDPNNKIALEGKQALEKLSSDASTTDSSDKNSSQKKSNPNSRGILGGLFGRKKNN
jgi:Flp pilus assembly protein TadD